MGVRAVRDPASLCFSFSSCKTGTKILSHVTSPALTKCPGLSLPLPSRAGSLGRGEGAELSCLGAGGKVSFRCWREDIRSGVLDACFGNSRKPGCLSRCRQCVCLLLTSNAVGDPLQGTVVWRWSESAVKDWLQENTL